MAPSKVAEKSTVWRVAGVARRDRFDVVDEAHVEHAVGLVEDQHFELRQVDAAAFDVVHQPARRRDQQVDAARRARFCTG